MLPTSFARLGQRGFDVVENLFDAALLAALQTEAWSLMPHASDHCVVADGAAEWRGGTPARRFQSAPGSAVQTGLFHSAGMTGFLQQWSGLELQPSGTRGSYSYYTRPGDHLSVHRDVDSCQVVLITCLHRSGRPDRSAGVLCLYPARTQAPISAIRATPELDVHRIDLAPGQSLVMHGGVIPHALSPLRQGQLRVVSILCYRLCGGITNALTPVA